MSKQFRREDFECPKCGGFLWTTTFEDGITYRHCGSCDFKIKADDFKPRAPDRDGESR